MSYNICPKCGKGNGVVGMTIYSCDCAGEPAAPVSDAKCGRCRARWIEHGGELGPELCPDGLGVFRKDTAAPAAPIDLAQMVADLDCGHTDEFLQRLAISKSPDATLAAAVLRAREIIRNGH